MFIFDVFLWQPTSGAWSRRRGAMSLRRLRISQVLEPLSSTPTSNITSTSVESTNMCEVSPLRTPDVSNGVKLEMFIFDVFPLAAKWCVVETERCEEFATAGSQ
eukprot:gene30054-37209_t